MLTQNGGLNWRFEGVVNSALGAHCVVTRLGHEWMARCDKLRGCLQGGQRDLWYDGAGSEVWV